VFVRDAAVDQEPAVPLDGRQHAGDGGARHHGVDERALGQTDLAPVEHVARDDVQRRRQMLDPLAVGVLLDQPSQRAARHEIPAGAEEAEEAGERLDGEHLAAPDAPPQRRELLDGLAVELAAREERAVDGADGRPDDDVGPDLVIGERAQHADLDRAEARTSRQDERGGHVPSARGREPPLRARGRHGWAASAAGCRCRG
jgi:hypothetical protein